MEPFNSDRPTSAIQSASESALEQHRAVRFPVAVLSVTALAQAALLLVAGHGPTRLIGVALAIASLNARIRLLAVLSLLIVANFGVHLIGLTPPYPYRLAHVAIVAAYGAMAVSGLVVVLLGWVLGRRTLLVPALAVALSVACALVVSEALLERVAPIRVTEGVKWIGTRQPHPILGEVYPPYGVLRTVYPDNPRGFFDDQGPSPWVVATHDSGSAASLELSPERAGVLRIQISRAEGSAPSAIQLAGPAMSVDGGRLYELSFRARAESQREISYGLSMAHPPFEGLGFSRDVTVGPDWQEFSDAVIPVASDGNAQLHFDVGANPASVEVEHVSLRSTPSGNVVTPTMTSPRAPTESSVTFRFNAYGCRGPDYPVPRPSGGKRILALGGGQTLGVGVQEWETFSARLEQSLNAAVSKPSTNRYEVINCGVNGYVTAEERKFYELVGSNYEPDIVLLSMAATDDMSVRDRQRLGYVHQTRRYEQLFLTAHLLQNARHEWRAPVDDYSDSVAQLLKLSEACRARKARLAVVFFRTTPLTSAWNALMAAASSRLKDANVPVFDLGQALLEKHTPDDLVVHRLDPNPNETAHRIASQEIERFLKLAGLIG